MSESLSAAEVKLRLEAACDAIVAAQDQLTHADQAIGDGDHGVGMARGFKAAHEALARTEPKSAADLLRAMGIAILGKTGGACGAVFGTLFLGMAKGAAGGDLDAARYAQALKEGLAAVEARGGAHPGDKTMLDALAPAADAAAQVTDIEGALSAAATAAVAGAEKTKEMIATTGKAKALGERSRGHIDPGALSLSIILGAIARAAPPA